MPAINPASATLTLVVAGVVEPTGPVAGAVVSHVPPAGVVAVAAVQLKALAQAPLAPIVATCAAGSGCPITPWKMSAGGVAVIVQGACTTKLTLIVCGLPAAALFEPSVPVIVIVPLYVPAVSVGNSKAVTVIDADLFAERLPFAGVTVSHAPPTAVAADVPQFRVPPPVLVMVAFWGSGFGWPMIPLKESTGGMVLIIGVMGCPMMNVTGKVCVPLDQLKTTAPTYVPADRPVTLTSTAG